MTDLAPVEDSIFDVEGVPPCPRCAGSVKQIRVRRRGGQFWWTYVWLLPCEHEVDEAHFYRGLDDDKPHGWTWVLHDPVTPGDQG